MAFKKISKIEQEMYGNRLKLDDGHSITGVFLYKDYDDVLIADAHYVNTPDYKGYVHCCGNGCPACKKGIRLDNKLFIPFLVIAEMSEGYDENQVIFWDRNQPFVNQLRKDVFDNYPNPTSLLFRITRHGAYRDPNTRYSITPVVNFTSDIDEVMADMGISFPDYYENIVKEFDPIKLADMLNSNDSSSSTTSVPSSNYSYQVKPRKRIADPEDLDDVDDLPGQPVQLEAEEEAVPAVDSLPSYSVKGSGVGTELTDEDDCEPTF